MNKDQKELLFILIGIALLIIGIALWLEFDIWLDLKVTKLNLAEEELIASIAIISYIFIWLRFVEKGSKSLTEKPAKKRK